MRNTSANVQYSRLPFATVTFMAPNVLFTFRVLALSLIAVASTIGQNANDINRSKRPGDDFYHYANGGWLRTATVPAGQNSFDTRAILRERTGQRVGNLIHEAAVSHAAKGSITQKVADYYASFMDQDAIESKGLAPLVDEMGKIASLQNKSSLSAYLGSTLNTEIDGLVSNSDHVFGLWVNQGFDDSKHNYPQLLQGGLGLPDRDSYLDASPKAVEVRARARPMHESSSTVHRDSTPPSTARSAERRTAAPRSGSDARSR